MTDVVFTDRVEGESEGGEGAEDGISDSAALIARQRWELENGIADPQRRRRKTRQERQGDEAGGSSSASGPEACEADALWVYDPKVQAAIQQDAPWASDPHYFNSVRISALALLKMSIHCRNGGELEVMGMMQGKIVGKSFIVIDAFALPVEGTETRVNAQAEAYEYMVDFASSNKQVGRMENVVGWYHSHPGYGCWMSGIDCSTQMLNQQYQEPFLAVVIDPHRTAAAGKVEIGAFRTFPEGYKPPGESDSAYQPIPLSKMEDFGVHARQYYPLEISYFKNSLDASLMDSLWNKYWVDTLSVNPLYMNREFITGQIHDLAEKIEQAENSLSHSGRVGGFLTTPESSKKEESALSKVARDSVVVATEQINGQASQIVKDLLFNFRSSMRGESSSPVNMVTD